MLTGTGFAHPMSGAPLTIAINGNRIVPIGSACTSGLSETRPSRRAVGSPSRSAVHACAISCTVSENSRTMNAMKICAKLILTSKTSSVRPTREKRKNAIRRFRSDDGRQLFARRPPHARETAERRQQRAPPARADAGHLVELRSEVARRAPPAMERHGEAVRLVADALNQEQRRIVGPEPDRIGAVARVEDLLFLRDAHGDEIRETELFERRVGGRQLTLAAVDQHEIRKRTALLEQRAI